MSSRLAQTSRRLALGEPLLAATLYAAILSARLRWWSIYEISPDEGLNLMKAALVAVGFRLHHEIWSDQPPVLTYVLAALHRLFPWNVAAQRALALCFAAWLIVSLFRIVRRSENRAGAWVSVIALCGSTAFVRSSAAVLVGLPALASALAALDQAMLGAEKGTRWRFAVAGFLFGLALQTKVFVAALLPALALSAFGTSPEARRSARSTAMSLVIFFVVSSGVALAIAFALDEPVLAQLAAPHASEAVRASHAGVGGMDHVLASIRPETLLATAALGVLATLLAPRSFRFVPIVWVLAAGLLLILHRPFWWHHTLLLEIPLAWLAGIATGLVPPGRWRPLGILALVALLGVPAAMGFEKTARRLDGDRTSRIATSPLAGLPPATDRWVVADRPMDAYRAGRLVPPELAVFSGKRIVSGNLRSDQIVAALNVRRPDRVVLRRFRVNDAVAAFLAAHYEPVESAGERAPLVEREPLSGGFDAAGVAAGRALACSQRRAGGWSSTPVPRGDCDRSRDFLPEGDAEPPMTFDDAATPSAVAFLLDLESDLQRRPRPQPEWLRPAIHGGLEAILRAQGDAGGWPQKFPLPAKGYARYSTLNDGATTRSIEVLLQAHRRFDDPRHLAAAIRGGEFILKTQGPPPQAGWAQQYDDALRPAPARSFEPAAYASRETGEVMNTLLDLHLATGDDRFVAPLAAARAWLESSTIRPGVWARLYEPGTNRPLYGDRDGAPHGSIAEISPERRAGYEWEERFPSVVRALARHDAWLASGTEGLRQFDRSRAALATPQEPGFEPRLGLRE